MGGMIRPLGRIFQNVHQFLDMLIFLDVHNHSQKWRSQHLHLRPLHGQNPLRIDKLLIGDRAVMTLVPLMQVA